MRIPKARMWLDNYIANPCDTEECIIWPFGTNDKGYAQLRYHGTMVYVSRVVLKNLVGDPPTDKHEAAHKPIVCHNPACVNVKHLDWKTRTENRADTYLDGTHIKGSKSKRSKLTEKQVLDIYTSLDTYRNLASKYGVSVSRISNIKNGIQWNWLTKHKS